MTSLESHVTVRKRAHYAPPWADVSIIAVAGSSGSGKSTLSQAIIRKLNLPWVVILSMVRLLLCRRMRACQLMPSGLLLQNPDS